MNKLSIKDRAQIMTAISEGMGVNAACRITGKSKNTVLKLIADVGHACAVYQDQAMSNLKIKDVQVDEIWSFVGAKQKNVQSDNPAHADFGDCYTFTAIDRETKLVPCWLVGNRTAECADEFMQDLAGRISDGMRIQLTSDGLGVYPDAVEKAFGRAVDFGVLNKTYGNEAPVKEAKRRYSPSEFTGSTKIVVTGKPDLARISTSHVERQNLSMRMNMRRFTRLTNAFSKKMENHMHAISFYFMVYNFVRIHSTTKVTPAMAAGMSSTLWSIEDIVMMSETLGE